MSRILRAIPRDDTIIRVPNVQGDIFMTTWAPDGRQYMGACDGGGVAPFTTFHNSRLLALDGGPSDLVVSDVPEYPSLDGLGRYYGFGTLAVGETLYQFLGTWELDPDGPIPAKFAGSKLISSPDGGRTWHNQDGSTPVVWEPEEERSRQTLIFWQEDQTSFGPISLLQMGQGYSLNRDGYVYGYSPNGATEGTMNELVMFRVPVDAVADRAAYEFFAARDDDGTAAWTPDLTERGVVHTFPSGWVNTKWHPWAWFPSVAYVEALDAYLMTTWGMGFGDDGVWFGRPSRLSILAAPQPWGPWTAVYENAPWLPGDDAEARCYAPVIIPGWIAEDGSSFWMLWGDFSTRLSPQEQAERLGPDWRDLLQTDLAAFARGQHLTQPYYGINLQRVDLVVSTE